MSVDIAFFTKTMNKDLALEGLQKIQSICPTSFLLFGTLLGCIRNNSFIEWDKDMDFGILYEDWKEEFADIFKKEGFVTLVDVFWSHPKSANLVSNEMLGKRSKIQMYYKDRNIRICFEVLCKGKNGHRYSGAGGAPRIFHCPEELISKTSKHDFYDIKVNVPENSEEFLSYVYGENWRTPDKGFFGRSEYKTKEKLWKIFLDG